MVGYANADNKFGPTGFVVGTVLGDGCNYSSVQTAINDASIGNIIYIRPGTYVENITLKSGVSLYGVSNSGFFLSPVIISGSITLDASLSPASFVSLKNLRLTNPAGDTLTSINAGLTRLEVSNCTITSPAGFKAVFLNNTSGTFSFATFTDCSISGDTVGIDVAQHQFVTCRGSGISSNSGIGFQCNNSSRCILDDCSITGSATAALSQNGISITTNYCTIIGNSCLAFDIPLGTVIVNSCNIDASDGTGFWAANVGALAYTDVILFTNTNIDPVTVQAPQNWQPYARSGVGPPPSFGTVRGTSCFDSAQFTVTDGFVQLAFPGGFQWTDQPASTTVTSNSGSFATAAAVTLTLPAAPVQGDVCKFKDVVGSPLVIQANAGQQLLVGSVLSAVAGSATGSAIGDAMELTFYSAGSFWVANSVVGVWSVV